MQLRFIEVAALGRDLAEDTEADDEGGLLLSLLLRRHGDARELVGVVVAAKLEEGAGAKTCQIIC